MYDKASLLREHAKEITEIIEATKEDSEDEAIRAEIAAALSASLNRKKMSTQSIKDMDLYRLAQAIKQAGSGQECTELLKRTFPGSWSIIFEKYNFAWRFPWREMKQTRQKELPKKMAEGLISGMEEEVQDLEKSIKELDEHIGELTKEIRKHKEK